MGNINITGTDGSTFSFPVGTDPATIANVISQHYATAGAQKAPAPPSSLAGYQTDANGVTQTSWGPSNTFLGGIAKGIDSLAGTTNDLTRLSQNGASLGLADRVAGNLPGLPDVAAQRAQTQDAADRQGVTGKAVELASSVVPMIGMGSAGLSAVGALPEGAGLASTVGANALDNGVLSAIQGAANSDTTGNSMASDALTQGALGAGIGAAFPLAAKAIGVMGGNQIMSALDPTGAAAAKMGQIYRRADMTPEQVATSLEQAAADGQGAFMQADALGNAGQRAMAGVVRQPTDARADIVEALRARQMDAGNRVANALSDAAGTPLTAAQYEAQLTAQRAEQAAKNYAPVKAEGSPIDVSAPVAEANRQISPLADYVSNANGAVPTDFSVRAPIEAAESQIRDPVANALKQARSYLASDGLTVTNVGQAFRAKTNIDQMIADATKNGQGAQVAALMPVQKSLDDALARTSPQYAAARDAYSAASNQIDAIGTGREAARGIQRPQDTIGAFLSQPSAQDAAFRVGYFDPKISQALSTKGTMSNAARPFISPRQNAEFTVFAHPGTAEGLQTRLGREMTMHDTMQQAMGGSRTADNLSDIADMGHFDPGIISDIAKGHYGRAVVALGSALKDYAAGQSGNVAERLGRALMETDPNAVRRMAQDNMAIAAKRDALAKVLMGTGSRVAASAPGVLSR